MRHLYLVSILYATAAMAGERVVVVDDTQPLPWDVERNLGYISQASGKGTNITLAGTVAFTGSTSTNGAMLLATNALGQAAWMPFYACKASITSTVGVIYSNNTARSITWDTEVYDYGNTWNGTTFTAPANGMYEIVYSPFTSPLAATCETTIKLLKNGVDTVRTHGPVTAAGYASIPPLIAYMVLTNGAAITFSVSGGYGSTNNLSGNGSAATEMYNTLSIRLIGLP